MGLVYRRYWRYASIDELTQITMLMSAAVVLQTLLFYSLHYWSDSPINICRDRCRYLTECSASSWLAAFQCAGGRKSKPTT